MVITAMVSLGSGPGLALFYRWKGVNEALGYCLRGFKQHNYSPGALQDVNDKKGVEDAERALAQDPNMDDASTHRRTLRLNKCAVHCSTDPQGDKIIGMLKMSSPVFGYLVLAFSSEAKTTEYVEAHPLALIFVGSVGPYKMMGVISGASRILIRLGFRV